MVGDGVIGRAADASQVTGTSRRSIIALGYPESDGSRAITSVSSPLNGKYAL